MIQTDDTTAESVEVDCLLQGASYSFRLWAFTRVGPGPWKEVDFDIPTVGQVKGDTSGSGVSNPAFVGVGIVIGVIFTVTAALLITCARHFRRRCLQYKRPDSSTSPNTHATDDTDAIYFNINDDIQLKKTMPSATPSRESATGASTVPSGMSTTRVSAPHAYTKRSTKKATKNPHTPAPDDSDAIYFDIKDDIELKKITATPTSCGSPTGASTVPSGKSTTRASAPRASTKRSTTKATKKPKMAAVHEGAHHYENTVIP
ncbi:uncharacterized protein LOC119736640 [Patiria miniata]|uniref:Fibronectin type-III domain-containing protein n=1 Tax=Patiria miniata TaxID=46514 RepID=A0A914ASY2_PATMI|nr:uncharacterized protein LOC119736640 [Patiria miniata]